MGDVLSTSAAALSAFSTTFRRNDELTDQRISHLLSNQASLAYYIAKNHDEACVKTLMSQATKQNNKPAMKIILEFIARRLRERLRNKAVRTWAGEEITGNGERETVLVCLYVGDCDIHMKYFYDLRIICREYDAINNESSIARSQELLSDTVMTKQMNDLVHQAINSHGQRLFEEHNNLETISSGRIISSKSRGHVQDVCIIVYCRLKGVIPFGEAPFPKQLKVNNKESVALDVREGFFSYQSDTLERLSTQPAVLLEIDSYLSETLPLLSTQPNQSPLKMGCNVGSSGCNISGTLGPFVRINGNNIGFLTCAHVVCGNALDQLKDLPTQIRKGRMRREVVQPANSGEICGRLLNAVFNSNWIDSTSNETCQSYDHTSRNAFGIDAAVIEITSRFPIIGEFASLCNLQLDKAGFTQDQPPRFNTGESMTFPIMNHFQRLVIKVGSETGLTRGIIGLTNGMVQYSSIHGNVGSINNTMEKPQIWHNVMQIHPTSERFCAPGDSGAGVFLLGDHNTLTCIGLLIGALSDGTGIVTPIDKVLTALNQDRGLRIELQSFLHDVVEEDR